MIAAGRGPVRLPLTILLTIAATTGMHTLHSAQRRPSFEVASIRTNNSGSGRVSSDLGPGGRVTLTNVRPY
jgi:hypothetical protein